MSLEEVLRFREKKALLQEKMIRENPGAVIVSLGMNIPGPVKSGPMIYAAFREGLERLEELSEKKKGMRTVKVLMEEAAGYAAVCQPAIISVTLSCSFLMSCLRLLAHSFASRPHRRQVLLSAPTVSLLTASGLS